MTREQKIDFFLESIEISTNENLVFPPKWGKWKFEGRIYLEFDALASDRWIDSEEEELITHLGGWNIFGKNLTTTCAGASVFDFEDDETENVEEKTPVLVFAE